MSFSLMFNKDKIKKILKISTFFAICVILVSCGYLIWQNYKIDKEKIKETIIEEKIIYKECEQRECPPCPVIKNKNMIFETYSIMKKILHGGDASLEIDAVKYQNRCKIRQNRMYFTGIFKMSKSLAESAKSIGITHKNLNPSSRISIVRKKNHIIEISDKNDLANALFLASNLIKELEIQKAIYYLEIVNKSPITPEPIVEKTSVAIKELKLANEALICFDAII